MAFEAYPKWLYHATEPAQIVPDEAAHAAAGDGWYESPADVPAAEPIAEPGGIVGDVEKVAKKVGRAGKKAAAVVAEAAGEAATANLGAFQG